MRSFITIILACVASTALQLSISRGNVTVPTFNINLDDSPLTRHTSAIRRYSTQLHSAYNQTMGDVNGTMKSVYKKIYETILRDKYPDFAAEIRGMSIVLNVTESDYFVYNFQYEINAMCTSIVARDNSSRIIIARNLDFTYTAAMRSLYAIFSYWKGGKELYRCGGQVGFVGLVTCMREGRYAVSMNLRRMGNMSDMLRNLREGRMLNAWMMQHIMETAEDYEAAKLAFRNAKTASGSYIIIAGMKKTEGIIMTRGRDGVEEFRELDDSYFWFRAQCNKDFSSEFTDYRTLRAHAGMHEIGKDQVTAGFIRARLLQKWPLYRTFTQNSDIGTVATVLMSPSQGTMDVTLAPEEAKWAYVSSSQS